MPSVRDIKRRIRSVENTRHITKAMKMVAVVKLRRAQERAEATRPYVKKMREVIASIANGASGIQHPMLSSRPVRKTGYLIITSDRGLAGGYNSNLLRFWHRTVQERHQGNDDFVIYVIGRKGLEFLKKRNLPVLEQVTGLPDAPVFTDIKEIAGQAIRLFEEEQFDELYLYYNEFINAVSQKPVEKRLLPFPEDEIPATDGVKSLYDYEPSAEEVLNAILPRYVQTLVYSALMEGKASEFAARMTAMDNATDNAGEILDKLKLQYNRARQAAITQEIAEIVGGAAALSK